jgi:UDP-N-acetylglucosamine 2-epimerase (non-hydrolysing)
MTIIGTRPQYIKIKPWYDYCKENNINNIMIDTRQHFTPNVSDTFIDEFKLEIDHSLNVPNDNPTSFISETIKRVGHNIRRLTPDVVLVIGDTNTTLAAALASNKLGVKVGHIEAGIRCGDKEKPEEMNRIIVDELSEVHFISRQNDRHNVDSPFFTGDLEYKLLNKFEDDGLVSPIEYQDFFLMTLHRQENLNFKRLKLILEFCRELKETIIFPIHHSTEKAMENGIISFSPNIKISQPMNFKQIVDCLCKCKGIISDSGGITKISPYFGKKCILPVKDEEWTEVIDKGYGIKELNVSWFDDYEIKRDRDFYYREDCCEVIWETLNEIFKP